MTELSFSALILSGKSTSGGEDDSRASIQRSVELFYDLGVEEIFVPQGFQVEQDCFLRTATSSRETDGFGECIRRTAHTMGGTHLLVLESGFHEMNPVLFLRLMQMSCLGMGVLPFVLGMCEPWVVCYPAAVSALGSGGSDLADERILATKALARGLVARYNIPPKDVRFFKGFQPAALVSL